MTYQQNGVFSCDECPETIETGERDFIAAKENATKNGWRTFKGPDDKWANACPVCVAEFAKSKRS
jgi:hypothetical protein